MSSKVAKSSLTILQLAAVYEQFDLIRFILDEYKIVNFATRQQKSVDPRILIIEKDGIEDGTLTLRTIIEHNNKALAFELWERYPHIFTHNDLMTMVRFLVSQGHEAILEEFFYKRTTTRLFYDLAKERR